MACRQGMALLLLCALFACSWAELLLPEALTPLLSPEGQRLLFGSRPREDYFLLTQHFVTQQNSAFCGVASSVTVLNALEVPRPLQDPKSELNSTRYAYYTQDNVFNAETDKVEPREVVWEEGMALEDLAAFLAAHKDVGTAFLHSDDTVTMDDFRSAIIRGLAAPDTFVIVNFNRDSLHEPGGGHHSPVAAYNPEADAALILDVSRYKYTAWWAPIDRLFRATEAVDDKTARGLVFAWKRSAFPNGPPSTYILPQGHGAAANQPPVAWLQPGQDNGRPWMEPMGVSLSEKQGTDNQDASADSGQQGVPVYAVVVVAVLAAGLGALVGAVFVMGGCGEGGNSWQLAKEWAQGMVKRGKGGEVEFEALRPSAGVGSSAPVGRV